MNEDQYELYNAIIKLCQQHGFTTEHTYELIEQAILSIRPDEVDLP